MLIVSHYSTKHREYAWWRPASETLLAGVQTSSNTLTISLKLDAAARILLVDVSLLCHDSNPDFPNEHNLRVDESSSDDQRSDNGGRNVHSVASVLMASLDGINRRDNPTDDHVNNVEDYRPRPKLDRTEDGSSTQHNRNNLHNDRSGNVLFDRSIFTLDVRVAAVASRCGENNHNNDINNREHNEEHIDHDGRSTHVAATAAAFSSLFGLRVIF